MADERGPTPTQEQLAKEVLDGRREITSSEPKMALTDAQRQQAIEATRGISDQVKMDTLPSRDVYQDVANRDAGTAITPGGVSAQRMQEQHPEMTQAPSPTPEPTPEPGG